MSIDRRMTLREIEEMQERAAANPFHKKATEILATLEKFISPIEHYRKEFASMHMEIYQQAGEHFSRGSVEQTWWMFNVVQSKMRHDRVEYVLSKISTSENIVSILEESLMLLHGSKDHRRVHILFIHVTVLAAALNQPSMDTPQLLEKILWGMRSILNEYHDEDGRRGGHS